MVGQTAEGLCADDIAHAFVDQFQHLGSQQPALTHFHAHTHVARRHGGGMAEGGRRCEQVVLPDGADQIVLLVQEEAICNLIDAGLEKAQSVQFVVHDGVRDGVQEEVHQPAHDRFGALGDQELFQLVVAQRGEFDEYLAHDAHLEFGRRPAGADAVNGGEVRDDAAVGCLDITVAQASGGHLLCQTGAPLVRECLCRAGNGFVGAALIEQEHDEISVQDGVQSFVQQGERDFEAGHLLQSDRVERDDRYIGVACPDQRLAQQRDVVGGAAAAAGLRQQQGDFVRVVLSALQGGDELPDDQNGRVAGIVVDVLQSGINDRAAVAVQSDLQRLSLVAEPREHAGHDAEMARQHGGHENGIGLAHFLCKDDTLRFGVPIRRVASGTSGATGAVSARAGGAPVFRRLRHGSVLPSWRSATARQKSVPSARQLRPGANAAFPPAPALR